jgi:hypothetical protein
MNNERPPIEKFKPMPGVMEANIWDIFRPERVQLTYYITIPVEPFDSGFEWEEQPFETDFCLRRINFPIKDWREFDGKSFTGLDIDDSECYIPYQNSQDALKIEKISFRRRGGSKFQLICDLAWHYGYDENMDHLKQMVHLDVEIEYIGLSFGFWPSETLTVEQARQYAAQFVNLEAYDPEPYISKHVWFDPSLS